MSSQAENSAGKAVDSIQQHLASYAAALRYDELPPEVVHTTKARIIDTLGILIGGFFGEPCRITRDIAAQAPAAHGASIIGTRMKASADLAAFVNATTSRYLEFSDVYHWPGSTHGHPSDVIMPVLAGAELGRASGRDFIAGVVLGYEVYCRIADVFHNSSSFDSTNFSTLASAVAAGKMLGLTEEQLAHCISMAVVPNVILRQVRRDHLSMWKEVAAGQAGRAGVFAAMLARAGMEGPHLPFEGKAGWCEHVARERFTLGAMGGRGATFKMLDTWIRHRPCMSEMIASILASEKIAPLSDVDGVQRILVETNSYAIRTVGSTAARPVWTPDTREIADHSIPYVVAATLLDGTLGLRSFDDAHLWNPRLRTLLPKIEIVENEEFTRAYKQSPRVHYGRVTVFMANGENKVGNSGGGADDLASPKTDAQISEKFRSLSEDFLGSKRVNGVLERLWNLDAMADIKEIPTALVID